MKKAKSTLKKTIDYIVKFSKKKDLTDKRNLTELQNNILKIIDLDENIMCEQDEMGRNLGMIAIEYGMEKVALRCAKNSKAVCQQDALGNNMGMYAVMHNMEKVAFEVLKNKEAALQTNNAGQNIGILAAYKDMTSVALRSYKIEETTQQKDKYGRTMVDIANSKKVELYLETTDDEISDMISSIYDEMFKN